MSRHIDIDLDGVPMTVVGSFERGSRGSAVEPPSDDWIEIHRVLVGGVDLMPLLDSHDELLEDIHGAALAAIQ